ncbi:hypothetical protein lerEdw1_000307 [Lerista edwardsae]|nr:hypothetical protein lerEdw1_000307 [Lerista edwardsae]
MELERVNPVGTSNAELPLVDPGMYQLDITLKRGHNLAARDRRGTSDPYVKFKMGGKEVFRSKTIHKNLNPVWEERTSIIIENLREQLYIKVFDYDFGLQDDFMGSAFLDLNSLEQNRPVDVTLKLKDPHYADQDLGTILLTVLLTPTEQQREMTMLMRKSWKRSSKSDPFCVVELNNDRLLTHTVYKNLNPEWNKIFTLFGCIGSYITLKSSERDPVSNVKDIHTVLEVTVYDEDRDRSADFLGKVAIPLLSIQNGEQKAYVLKNKQLTGPTKGVIYLEIDVIFNAVKASLRTLVPKEQKYIEEENRLSKQLLLRNFVRMKRCVMVLINAAYYINSCFDWDSPPRSLAAFLV